MKKILVMSLVLILVISFFGCTNKASNEKEIKNALVGKWGSQTQDGVKNENIGWIFNADGTASSFVFGTGSKGTYVIEENKIVLTYESGDSTYFIYSYSNGELKLKSEDSGWWNLWKQ